MKIRKRALFIAAIALAGPIANASPMNPATQIRTQADGSKITVQMQGDEHYNFTQSSDGYLLLPDYRGVLYFADENGAISSVKAKNVSERSAKDKSFLAKINKEKVKKLNLENATLKHIVPEGYTPHKPAWLPSGSSNAELRKPTSESYARGTNRFPVLLVSSSDKNIYDSAAYSQQLNLTGYSANGHSGSVKDYFTSQSNNQFIPNFDVYKVSVSKTFSSYQKSNADGAMIQEAIASLLSNYPNFDATKYDDDGDGEIDAVAVVYAGTESEANAFGGYEYHLEWSDIARTVSAGNNKVFNTFFLIAEMESSLKILPIATFIHEFSHTLGLMDHYDTKNFSTNCGGTHAWDVMSTGMYNNNGGTPAGYNAFEKQFCGWFSPITLSTSSNITAIPALNAYNVFYTVPVSGDDNEWFLLENRQKTGWDAYLPGHGMLIWHIDYDQSKWNADELNTDNSHQDVDIAEAGSKAVPSYYDGFSNDGTNEYLADDPYPGTSNITSFSNFISWSSIDQGIKLYNIIESNSTICFATQNGVSVTNCSYSESSSSAAGSSSSQATGTSSSSVSISSSSLVTAAATLIKYGSGDPVQSVTVGNAITSFYYMWTNATGVTVSGLPNGVAASIDASQNVVTISGIVSSSVITGTYAFTVTTTGNAQNATASGSFTVTSSTKLSTAEVRLIPKISFGNKTLTVSIPLNGTKTLRIYSLKGKLLGMHSFESMESTIDVSKYSRGSMIATVKLENKTVLQKEIMIE
ncbi:MAG: M6 family metalloprotease domain-containing protein [Fibrobacteraceae bacterium]